jgi:predicted MFS family arabinose efflux permease
MLVLFIAKRFATLFGHQAELPIVGRVTRGLKHTIVISFGAAIARRKERA